MSAAMCPSWAQACVAPEFRERYALSPFFLERQGVDIRPEGDRLAAGPALEDGPEPRAGHFFDGKPEAS